MSYAVRRSRYAVNIWPGFVDALATLILVFIFMLVVFVFAQLGLSDALSKRTSDVVDLESEIVSLNEQLDEQKRVNQELQRSLQILEQRRLAQLDEFQNKLAVLQNQRLRLELYADQLTGRLMESHADVAQAQDQNVLLQGQLTTAQELTATLNQRISELSRYMAEQTRQQDQLHEQLENTKLQQQLLSTRLLAANSNIKQLQTEADETADDSKKLQQQLLQTQTQIRLDEDEHQREVSKLEQTLAGLAEQNKTLSNLLKISAQQLSDKNQQMSVLQQRLDDRIKADEGVFSGYRSEFFTQLREVLGEHPDIRVVGDRFLFQSELLFASGSADLGGGGRLQLNHVAETLNKIAQRIPQDVNWVLQVNGHTDKRPISTSRFPSNWELSTERALSIVRYLIKRGIPPQRLAATGFAEFDPIAEGDDSAAHTRNRRIELKFTNR